MSSRSSVLLLWRLRCGATSMKMTKTDIRSTPSRSREDTALSGAAESSCLQVQTKPRTRLQRDCCFQKYSGDYDLDRGKKIDKQLRNTLMIIVHIVTEPLCKVLCKKPLRSIGRRFRRLSTLRKYKRCLRKPCLESS